MPRLVRGLVLAGALLLAGCGVGGNDARVAVEQPKITQARLAAMVLPQAELGTLATGMKATPSSGPVGNALAAEDSADPNDTATSLKGAGRVAGEQLALARAGLAAARKSGGVALAGSEVELMQDTVYAAQYLHKQLADYARFVGRTEDGATLKAVSSFEAHGVGDESEGLRATVSAAGEKLYVTLVAFRRGRIVGSAWLARVDRDDARDEAHALAVKLDKRIEDVLAGRLGPAPAPPKEDEQTEAFAGFEQLPGLTVSARDVAPGARAANEGRAAGDGYVSYFRVFEDVRLGGSHLIKLRVETQLYRTKTDARRAYRQLRTSAGRRAYARKLLGTIETETGLESQGAQVLPLSGAGRDFTGIVVTFDSRDGSYRFATVATRSGKRIAVVTGFCHALGLDPADLDPLARRARSRLVA